MIYNYIKIEIMVVKHNMSIFNVYSKPIKVTVQTENKWLELDSISETEWRAEDIEFYSKCNGIGMELKLKAPVSVIKRVKIRWSHKFSDEALFLGDAWERGYGDMEWRHFVPERIMPWYFMVNLGAQTYGYGIKTCPKAMCFWQVDGEGISLWLDVRNGGGGVQLGQRILDMATVVVHEGLVGESAFKATTALCKAMCDKPRVSKQPIYGANNWYYAYGNSSHAEIIEDTKLVVELSPKGENRPFMVIDDGWQICHNGSCNGGPWNKGNYKFPDMGGLAREIKELGAKPGIWMRPLLTAATIPQNYELPMQRLLPHHIGAWKDKYMDPSIPEVIELIKEDVKHIAAWGYKLIKHDFSTFDIFGRWGFEMNGDITSKGWNFSDKSRTSAEIIVALYSAIREAAGEDITIIGCNTIGHLGAGFFDSQRIGDDTSGMQWERTRRYGVNSLAFRMPQHGTFFDADGDCVGITEKVSWEFNEQWLRLLSQSGTPLFVSAKKEAIGDEQKKALAEAYEISSKPIPIGEPLDWMETSCPSKWLLNGKIEVFDWFKNEGAYLGKGSFED